jgi:FtsZ-binding cell division protein ZapB
MSKLGSENEQLKKDSSMKQKSIRDLHAQLEEVRTKQTVATN